MTSTSIEQTPSKNDLLHAALDNHIVRVMKESSLYSTKEAISQKVLQDCATILNVDLNCFNDKNFLSIHDDNMSKIDLKWQSRVEANPKVSHEDANIYKLVKSSNIVNSNDVEKLINTLTVKDSQDFINELLAVDGFQGFKDTKKYLQNLKVGDKGSEHIQVIREIYRDFKVPAVAVYYALLKVYEKHIPDKEVDIRKNLTTSLDELSNEVTDYDIAGIVEFYEKSVSDVKQIATAKLGTLRKLKKKPKESSSKRKLKGNAKPNKKAKSKNAEPPASSSPRPQSQEEIENQSQEEFEPQSPTE